MSPQGRKIGTGVAAAMQQFKLCVNDIDLSFGVGPCDIFKDYFFAWRAQGSAVTIRPKV
jgi:hypothetical protein